MIVRALPTAEDVAAAAAEWLVARARSAIEARGCFSLAVSGGRTPWMMLRRFARADLPWSLVHIFQVDERVAPEGHADRNWTQLSNIFHAEPSTRAVHLSPMPVAQASLGDAVRAYAEKLEAVAGTPPSLDVVHLGLGADGHTASLVPDDVALGESRHDVAVTGIYKGRRRLTLTYPLLARSRAVLWVVTGAEKRDMVTRLLAKDPTIPAGRVDVADATLLVDRAAAPDSLAP